MTEVEVVFDLLDRVYVVVLILDAVGFAGQILIAASLFLQALICVVFIGELADGRRSLKFTLRVRSP
jgi:hypothetical protein